jgi:hypothetical protein
MYVNKLDETVQFCKLHLQITNFTETVIILQYTTGRGHAVAQWLRHCALQIRRSQDRFPVVSLEFFSDIILLAPGANSASNRNEYQEYFLGVKAAGAYG